jgi:hypothetical protein
MKNILSDFINLIYPRPEGETYTWGEILLVLGMLVLLSLVAIVFL